MKDFQSRFKKVFRSLPNDMDIIARYTLAIHRARDAMLHNAHKDDHEAGRCDKNCYICNKERVFSYIRSAFRAQEIAIKRAHTFYTKKMAAHRSRAVS